MKKTIAFHTLGCKVNQYDTEAVVARFKEQGYLVVGMKEKPSVVLINTCTVTNEAAKKSRQAIRKSRRENPEATLVVMGCYSQVFPEEAGDVEGVDIVLGTSNREEVVSLVTSLKEGEKLFCVTPSAGFSSFEELPLTSFEGRTRASIKIQDGCDSFCTYCQVPYARGPSRSRDFDRILHLATHLARNGYQELVLTGVHLGSYGEDLEKKRTISEVVAALCEIKGIARVRLSSIDPHEIHEDLIRILAHEKVCNHLHIPLQSGVDRILSLMGRKYTTADYRACLANLRAKIPDIAISTDVIVGFPTETREDFSVMKNFLRECAFSKIHVFPYSKRKHTPASLFVPEVEKKEKEDRVLELTDVSLQLANSFQERYLGQTLPVLFEEMEEAYLIGLTRNYIRVRCTGGSPLDIGQIKKVSLLALDAKGVAGVLLPEGESTR